MLTLDAVTAAELAAVSSAEARAAVVQAALGGVVSVRVYDGAMTIVGQGQLSAPWATLNGATLVLGQLQNFVVLQSGTPTASWQLRFESGSRWLAGTFGLANSTADFRWSAGSWSSSQSGTFGTITLTAIGQDLPSASSAPVQFAEVPELVFVRGCAETDNIACCVLDTDNRVLPGDTFWMTPGSHPQRHWDHAGTPVGVGGGVWTAAKLIELVSDTGDAVTLPEGVSWDATHCAVVYNGHGPGTAKAAISETIAVRLKCGAVTSNVFNLRVLVPTIVYGDNAVQINQDKGWNVPAANVVQRDYPSGQNFSLAYRKMKLLATYDAPNVFFVTAGTYRRHDGEVLYSHSGSSPSKSPYHWYILGDPASRPFLEAYDGVKSNDEETNVHRFTIQYGRQRYVKNFDLRAITLSSGAACGLAHEAAYGKHWYRNIIVKVNQYDSWSNNDYIGMALGECSDGNGPSYRGTALFIMHLRQSNLGGGGNTYHSMYLEGRPHGRARINNLRIDGTRLCSAIQSTMYDFMLTNSKISIAPDDDPDYLGFRTTDQLDIHAFNQAVIYNNYFVPGCGQPPGAPNQGCLSGPIFLECRRAVRGGNDMPPYPNIAWQRLPEDGAQFSSYTLDMAMGLADDIAKLDTDTRSAYDAIVEGTDRAAFIAGRFVPSGVAQIYTNVSANAATPDLDATTLEEFSGSGGGIVAGVDRAEHVAATFSGAGVAEIYRVVNGVDVVYASVDFDQSAFTAAGNTTTLTVPGLLVGTTANLASSSYYFRVRMNGSGRWISDRVRALGGGKLFVSSTDALEAGQTVTVTSLITWYDNGVTTQTIVYASVPLTEAAFSQVGAKTVLTVPELLVSVNANIYDTEGGVDAFFRVVLDNGYSLSDRVQGPNSKGGYSCRFKTPTNSLTAGTTVAVTGEVDWPSWGRAYFGPSSTGPWTEFTHRALWYGSGSTKKDWKWVVEPGEMPLGKNYLQIVDSRNRTSPEPKIVRVFRDASQLAVTSFWDYEFGVVDGWDYDDVGTFVNESFWQAIASRPKSDPLHPHTWKHWYSYNTFKFLRFTGPPGTNKAIPLYRAKGSMPVEAPWQFASPTIFKRAPVNFEERTVTFWCNNRVVDPHFTGNDLFDINGPGSGLMGTTTSRDGQIIQLFEIGNLWSAQNISDQGSSPASYPRAVHPKGFQPRTVVDVGGNNFDTGGVAEKIALPGWFRITNPQEVPSAPPTQLEAAAASVTSGFSAALDVPSLNWQTPRQDPYNRMRAEFGGPNVLGSDYPSTGGGCATSEANAAAGIGRYGGDARAWIWGSRMVWDPVRKMVLGIYTPHLWDGTSSWQGRIPPASGPAGNTSANELATLLFVYSDAENIVRMYEGPLAATTDPNASGFAAHLFDNTCRVGRTLYKMTHPNWSQEVGYYFAPQVVGINIDAITPDPASVLQGAAVVSDIGKPMAMNADIGTAVMDYHEASNKIVLMHKSKLWFYSFGTSAWEPNATGHELNFTVGTYHQAGHYNPTSQWFVGGGGAGAPGVSYQWIGVNPAGQIVALDNCPVIISMQEQPSPGTQKACGTYIPGSNESVFFHNNGNIYGLDPTRPPGTQWRVIGTVPNEVEPIDWACAIPELGCVLVGSYGGYGTNRMMIWKP